MQNKKEKAAEAKMEKQEELRGKREEAKDTRYAKLHTDITQMKIDSDEKLKKIDAAWHTADKSQAADNQLLKIWEVAQGARGTAEAKIANILKDPAYERALADSNMDPSSSPAAAKIQAQGKTALEEFAKTFKTMRENADRTASAIEDRLRTRKIDIPSASTMTKFDSSKLTGDDKSAYDWANNPKSPGWTKEKADAIKKQLGG
jgi:hypothetical protein